LAYLRNGTTLNSRPQTMDELTYGYNLDGNGRLLNNRLRHVKDAVSSGNYTTDIDDQGDDNYAYDEIGNLISDDQEGISEITWNVYGKISSITKSGPVTITYDYDASGNRIGKTVGNKHTWYVRDASGNVMAMYEDENVSINSNALSQIEVHLYGSARLGMWQTNRNVASPPQPIETPLTGLVEGGVTVGQERGEKIFELSNQLGNVLVTISDRKIEHNTSGTTIDYYEASVVSATDYAPFGLGLEERKYSVDGYRYGFNGKENDNEVKGEGNQQDYGMRIYDPRLGRFLSMDPLSRFYPWYTPYQFAGNDVIRNIDLDGGEPKPKITPMAEGQQEETSKEVTNARGDYVETRTQIWNWHGGGILKRQEYNQEGQKVNTYSRAGWYTNEEYDKLLKTGTELNHSNSL